MVATIICACLAGCVPSRPDKYILKWAESENRAIKMDKTEIGIDGNKIISKIDDKNQIIYEETKDKVNVYICTNGTWTAKSMTLEEAKQDEGYQDAKDEIKIDDEDKKTFIDEFEKNFEKKDGWWTMKGENPFGSLQMKVDGKELVVKITAAGATLEMRPLVLNYKISIPKEAKDALK